MQQHSPTGDLSASGEPLRSPAACIDAGRGISPLKQLLRQKEKGQTTTKFNRNRTNRPCTTMMIGYAPGSMNCVGTGQVGSFNQTGNFYSDGGVAKFGCDSAALQSEKAYYERVRHSSPIPVLPMSPLESPVLSVTHLTPGGTSFAQENRGPFIVMTPSPVSSIPSSPKGQSSENGPVRMRKPPGVPPRTSSVRPTSGASVESPSVRSPGSDVSSNYSMCFPGLKVNTTLSNCSSPTTPILTTPALTPTPSQCSSISGPFYSGYSPQTSPEPITPVEFTNVSKPKVDAKLLRSSRPSRRKLLSRSLDNLDSVEDDVEKSSPFDQLDELRKSFLKKEIHLECDTLSRQLFPRSFKESVTELQNSCFYEKPEAIYSSLGDLNLVGVKDDQDEKTYALPEPQSYGDGTLKAVKRITDKYDSLQMRKLRARSFRAGSNLMVQSLHSSTGTLLDCTDLAERTNIMLTLKDLNHPQPNLEAVESNQIDTSKLDISSVVPEVVVRPKVEEEVVSVTSGLTDRDISRVEMFYRSRSSEVCNSYICHNFS